MGGRRDVALLVLRAALGVVLVDRGWFLLTDPRWPGVFGRAGLPAEAVPAVAALEILCGLALALGVAARPAAVALVAWTAPWTALIIAREPGTGWMLPFFFLAAAVTILLAGTGRHAARASAPLAPDFGAWPIRVALGGLFLVYGWRKFAWWDQWLADFAAIGIPWPALTVPLVGVVELAGGAAILSGVATRSASVSLLGVLTVAVVLAWLPLPMSAGWNLDLLAAGCLLAVGLAGPGRPTLASVTGLGLRDPEEWALARLRG